MTKWNIFQKWKDGSIPQINQYDIPQINQYDIPQLKYKNHMIISIDAEKHLTKFTIYS